MKIIKAIIKIMRAVFLRDPYACDLCGKENAKHVEICMEGGLQICKFCCLELSKESE